MLHFTLYDVLNIYWLNRVSKVWRPLNESAALVSMLLSPRKSFIKSCSQDCDADRWAPKNILVEKSPAQMDVAPRCCKWIGMVSEWGEVQSTLQC